MQWHAPICGHLVTDSIASNIETKVCVKPKNSSLLLHYQSHVDNWYKQGLLRTMLDRAYRLASCWSHFSDECNRLKTAFFIPSPQPILPISIRYSPILALFLFRNIVHCSTFVEDSLEWPPVLLGISK